MVTPKGVLTARGMLLRGTPIENYSGRYGLWVKREDLACPPPGPPFSKARGVYYHILNRPEKLIGVLDTVHSQAGHAVARACQVLKKDCVNFYPWYKKDAEEYKKDVEDLIREPQKRSRSLGAELFALQAGRSCILFHQAKKEIERRGGYMMPNALKLSESIEETAQEVLPHYRFDQVLIPISSGTLAAGVIKGFEALPSPPKHYIIHLGYHRSNEQVFHYLYEATGLGKDLWKKIILIDEEYAYKDQARPGETPPWPCNPYYDLKAFRWWLRTGRGSSGKVNTLFWNIG